MESLVKPSEDDKSQEFMTTPQKICLLDEQGGEDDCTCEKDFDAGSSVRPEPFLAQTL
ncbi:Hypothetical predicted protein [Xyrichtys novacula]|uniref:Uncharacterized protein n=1 Tax=Xyrichtys novacula TaxID=13765 RepID=A0AAV1HDN1_XYRNO|nr:Hypothetical predicted protein [Xyrichtys novacula]